MTIFRRRFWRETTERAVKTVAQAAVALIPAGATIDAVDWPHVAGSALLAGVLSVLTSVASSRRGDRETPSLV